MFSQPVETYLDVFFPTETDSKVVVYLYSDEKTLVMKRGPYCPYSTVENLHATNATFDRENPRVIRCSTCGFRFEVLLDTYI